MLEIRQVRKVFHRGTPSEVRALQGVDLATNGESFVVVIGTNGSGKTTLLNAVAGTIFVDSGSIFLDGNDITRWPEHRRAKLIGRVFQNPFSGTAPHMTIAENLAMAICRGHRRGFGWALSKGLLSEFRDRVRQLNMGLEDRLNSAIGTLSGGQRQALTLLMATCLRPRLLLLDEHTAALDPKSAEQVIELTTQIIQREKLNTLMVTHSMRHAVNLGNRLIMVNRGEIIQDFQGAEKLRLRVEDLLIRFEEVRRAEQLDQSAAQMLEQLYL